METKQQGMPFTVFGSVITFLLQVMIAPNIAIYDVVPNFFLVFVVLNSMLTNRTRACATGFILGLLYDFLSPGAPGTMAFVLTIIGYSVGSLNKDLFAESWVSQVFFLLLASFFAELLHSVFLSILGFDTNFLTSLGMRVLPASIYNTLFGLVVIFIMFRLSERRKKKRGYMKGRFD